MPPHPIRQIAGLSRQPVSLPAVPAVSVNATKAALLTPDGELKLTSHDQARLAIHQKPVLVCHAPYVKHRLGLDDLAAFDVLELFAFAHPAKFCVPTPAGLARALGLAAPEGLDDHPSLLEEATQILLSDLSHDQKDSARSLNPVEVAKVMGLNGKGWRWTPFVLSALGVAYDAAEPLTVNTALNVWRHLPEWTEGPPPPPPAHEAVSETEITNRLEILLHAGQDPAELRPQQTDYAHRLAAAFGPMNAPDTPAVILAEAGTGVGKTLGYLAPASVWAEKNKGAVWISTYTKNLQRQIDQELSRLYTDPETKAAKAAIRKGRENYLCLLNLEDMAVGAALAKQSGQAIAAGLMARWVEATRDGDLSGGDFPAWLSGLLGHSHSTGLADRRGECIYAACDHYHRCFVEKSVRRAQRADIVIANHALVMNQTALAGDTGVLPRRYVFDEGHHLFDAADSAFAAHLSAWETADLRRWIKGNEGGRQSRARGLRRRVEDLIAGDDVALHNLEDILQAATALPAPGWSKRLKDKAPFGATESFLAEIYNQVHARAEGRDGPYSLETDARPATPDLIPLAEALESKLTALQKPMRALSSLLKKRLHDHAATLESDTRNRIESLASGLDRRSDLAIGAWISMLHGLKDPMPPKDVCDWMEVERIDGQAVDVGLFRHWIDPMKPFAAALRPQAHGVAITSATLRDDSSKTDANWDFAVARTGAHYLTPTPQMFSVPSPFDYAAQTKIIVITDVKKEDMKSVAAAYRALFTAAGGGALGLFTAIHRLRAVQGEIAAPLEQSGISLYAQHTDGMDTGTLVDIFREERHSCLLGTDAVRDGIDVPGESLRLVVYDRVPWPRPTILHRARREAFGGRDYDELSARLKLRQAYGRLIRRADDRGVFVMLDSRLPSRLHNAFPEGVQVERLGLADAVAALKTFFAV